jgi:hypothetical protein
VRAIQKRRGHLIDRTERLANSLGKLCATVASLNEHLGSGKVAFSGQNPLARHAAGHQSGGSTFVSALKTGWNTGPSAI